MPYYLGFGYSENKPIMKKMGLISLDNNTSLGIPINSFGSSSEVINAIKKLLEDIEKERYLNV